MRRLACTVLIGGLATGSAMLAACADDPADDDATPTTVPAPAIGLDEIQVLAAHNAYHLEGEPALLQAITANLPEVDYRSTCLTFVTCLTELRTWSEAHPDHLPILIQLETKDGVIDDPIDLGFVQPIPASEATFTALEAEIRSVLDPEQLVAVADVQGDASTLREGVEAEGWPDVDALRGRFIVTLDDAGAKRDLYRSLHPDTRDRLVFVAAEAPDPDAAFAVVNDPVAEGARIRELVEQGYLVRTRTDADTVEARSGDTTRRDAAFESGAQIISTDYEREDPRFPGYIVTLPGGGPARCNPVTAPEDCDEEDLGEG